MSFTIRIARRLLVLCVGYERADLPRKRPAVCGLVFGLLIALPMLSPNSVHAGWVTVEKRFQTPSTQTVYFDPETIRRQNDLATLWQLADIKWGDGVPTPRFLSAKTHKQFDCLRLRVRVLAILEFSRQMATGKSWSGYIENGNWQAVEAQSVNHALWEAACKKK